MKLKASLDGTNSVAQILAVAQRRMLSPIKFMTERRVLARVSAYMTREKAPSGGRFYIRPDEASRASDAFDELRVRCSGTCCVRNCVFSGTRMAIRRRTNGE